MDLSIVIFLMGGLFLGWSLGANDAANVFGIGTEDNAFSRYPSSALSIRPKFEPDDAVNINLIK